MKKNSVVMGIVLIFFLVISCEPGRDINGDLLFKINDSLPKKSKKEAVIKGEIFIKHQQFAQ